MSFAEQGQHINVLEWLAVEYALKSFEFLIKGKHVKVLSDNSCAMAYLTLETDLDNCQSYSRRNYNVLTDSLSRIFNDRTEWTIFQSITELCLPEIDMFASRLYFQLWKPFVS